MTDKKHIISYLLGDLSAEDQRAFEADMNSNKELAARVADHRYFMTHVEGYTLGELDAESEEKFRVFIEEHPEFQQDLALQKEINFAVKHGSKWSSMDQLLQNIREKNQEEDLVPPKQRSRNLWLYAGFSIAAALGILLLIRFVIFPPALTLEEEIANAMQAYPVPEELDIRSEEWVSTQTEDRVILLMEQALASYSSMQYDSAISLFDAVRREGNFLTLVYFYQGMSYMMTGQVDQALQRLFPVSQGSSDYVRHAYWYMALIHLQRGEIELARPMLQGLTNDPVYEQQAQHLLSTLNL